MSSIYRAYDIRGKYPLEINEQIAFNIGRGVVEKLRLGGRVGVGYDARKSSPSIFEALVSGVCKSGSEVVDLGMISTEVGYYMGWSGKHKLTVVLIVTASHNSGEWNGVKIIDGNGVSIGYENGIGELGEYVDENSMKFDSSMIGTAKEKIDAVGEYIEFLVSKFDRVNLPKRVLVNANYGVGGMVFERCINALGADLDIEKMNFYPNGDFPAGDPDPLLPENIDSTSGKVDESGCEIGVSFDSDADRIVFFDRLGRCVYPYVINWLLCKGVVNEGETVVCDGRGVWAIEDMAEEKGGVAVRSKSGHLFVKQKMEEVGARMGFESTGHVYFGDFGNNDGGLFTFFKVLEALEECKIRLESVLDEFDSKYYFSQEREFEKVDIEKLKPVIIENYQDLDINFEDGIDGEAQEFRFNIRKSNTEDVVRLNIEARSKISLNIADRMLVSLLEQCKV